MDILGPTAERDSRTTYVLVIISLGISIQLKMFYFGILEWLKQQTHITA